MNLEAQLIALKKQSRDLTLAERAELSCRLAKQLEKAGKYEAAGTFYQQGELVFWDVQEPAKTIVIELEHGKIRKLIIEVAGPEREVQEIRASSGESPV